FAKLQGVALEVSSCNPWAFLTNASGKSQTHVEGLADTGNRNQAHNRQVHTAAVPWSRNTKPVCYSHESIQQPEVKLTIPSIVALGPARFTRLVFDSQFLPNERMVLLLYSSACPHSSLGSGLMALLLRRLLLRRLLLLLMSLLVLPLLWSAQVLFYKVERENMTLQTIGQLGAAVLAVPTLLMRYKKNMAVTDDAQAGLVDLAENVAAFLAVNLTVSPDILRQCEHSGLQPGSGGEGSGGPGLSSSCPVQCKRWDSRPSVQELAQPVNPWLLVASSSLVVVRLLWWLWSRLQPLQPVPQDAFPHPQRVDFA
ncbi:hypothetical protein QJQ45_014758, partial [Haematococcus lacustris]